MNDKQKLDLERAKAGLMKFFTIMGGEDQEVPFPVKSVLTSMVIEAVPPNFVDAIFTFAKMNLEELQASVDPDNRLKDPQAAKMIDQITVMLTNSMIVRALIGAGIVDADLFREAYWKQLDIYRQTTFTELNRMSSVLRDAGFKGAENVIKAKLEETLEVLDFKIEMAKFTVETVFLDPAGPGPQLLENWNPIAARTAAAKLIHPEKAELIAEVEKLL
jgi:hypothetical protein